jgi:lactate dehydrogenase-like 2-hydroxyacid dehydrogenase
MFSSKLTVGALLVSLAVTAALSAPALAQGKPNILVIMSDDVGVDNVSVYHVRRRGR